MRYNIATMEPRIHYATTTDGVKIAYWAMSEGPPFVYVPPPPWSHCQLEWQIPENRVPFERRARRNAVVRFDWRGSGLSDRKVAADSLEAMVMDLEAVVDRLDLGRVALYGWLGGAKVAIAYAAAHPARVGELIIWNAEAAPHKSVGATQEALRAVRGIDWDLYLETGAHIALGWTEEMSSGWAAFQRQCCDGENARRAVAAIESADVSALLARVTTPTLVLYRPFPLGNLEASREVAARIANARLVILKEGMVNDRFNESEEGAIDEFLNEIAASAACPDGLTPREVEVLRLVALGRSNNEIARDLVLSVRTVARHIANSYVKIGAHGRAEATAYALRRRLISE